MGIRPRPEVLEELARALAPGGRVVGIEPLGADGAAGATHKAAGYGAPIRLRIRAPAGERAFVLRTARADDFGHDRRSDRAQGLLLAFDTFRDIPRHVSALDVGAFGRDGRLISLRGAGEFYLVTAWAPGALYAEDLRRIGATGWLEPLDLARCERLVACLVELHAHRGAREAAYARAVRDLVGHGEGIFGIVDGYPPDTPAAPPARLREIERRALEWRWRLRGRGSRLARVHGDFHPFNVVFASGDPEPTLLDASRGGWGEPADDVTCLAVNFLFFGLDRPARWAEGLGTLWRRFWGLYLAESRDPGLLDVAAPFVAWRCLVLACPRFYPALAPADRDALLGLAERALDAPRFDPALGADLFA